MTNTDTHPWLAGTVVRGDGRGEKLGFPTANIVLDAPQDITPAIYAAWVKLAPHKEIFPAAVHIGPRPTFPGATPSFEVHLINFPFEELYERLLQVQLVKTIRDIKSFASTTELKAAITEDITKALEILHA